MQAIKKLAVHSDLNNAVKNQLQKSNGYLANSYKDRMHHHEYNKST